MKKLLEATQKAKQDTASIMTVRLRQNAKDNGWDSEVANALHVKHSDGKFVAHVHPDYAERAFVHEYGNENIKPTASIRKFMNDPKIIDEVYMSVLNHHWKKAK